MKIEARVVLREDHEAAVNFVYMKSGGDGSVHRDAADFAHGSKGQNVGDRGWVIPDRPKIWDITDELGNLCATVGVHGDVSVALANVQQ
jgi:hypothetical protein